MRVPQTGVRLPSRLQWQPSIPPAGQPHVLAGTETHCCFPARGRETSFHFASKEVTRPGAHPCSQSGVRDGLEASHLQQVQAPVWVRPQIPLQLLAPLVHAASLQRCRRAAALTGLCPVPAGAGAAAEG